MHHCSTGEQRSQWISQLLVPNPRYGLVSQLSRTHQVSRQTLYRWKRKGAQALQVALESPQIPTNRVMQVQEQVLTLLIEAHASYRSIQTCLRKLCGTHLSLGSIAAIVQEAGQRAQRWLSQQQASTPRSLALDEQYSSQRGKAYQSAGGCSERPSVGDGASGGSGRRKLDVAVVVFARARIALRAQC